MARYIRVLVNRSCEELLPAIRDTLFCCESIVNTWVIREVLYSQYGCSCISIILCVHHMKWMNALTGFFCGDSQLQYPGFRFTYIPAANFCCICENKRMIKLHIMTWILSVTSYVSTYARMRACTHTHTIHWCQGYVRSSHLLNSILLI